VASRELGIVLLLVGAAGLAIFCLWLGATPTEVIVSVGIVALIMWTRRYQRRSRSRTGADAWVVGGDGGGGAHGSGDCGSGDGGGDCGGGDGGGGH